MQARYGSGSGIRTIGAMPSARYVWQIQLNVWRSMGVCSESMKTKSTPVD